jgi:hypothetical protein
LPAGILGREQSNSPFTPSPVRVSKLKSRTAILNSRLSD